MDEGKASLGLSAEEAARRLREVGPNALPETAPTALWRRFLRQFASPLIYILLAALGFDLALWLYAGASSWPVEGMAIAAVLLLNAGLGAIQEHRSEQVLAQLRILAAPLAWVARDGQLTRIPSREIVPGDRVRIEAGERIPADGTLLEELGVMVDESILTGESVPIDKSVRQELFSGTLVVRGKGQLSVTRTGAESAMGRLATMLGEVRADQAPLERRLAVLARQIARGVGALAVLLAVAGLATEGIGRFGEVVLFAVALAVAAIPEGMPAVVTLTLALGVQRMARRQAVVRRLSAVEALGSVTVIATDKTGTLTENRMSVHALESDDPGRALLAMTLANDADDGTAAGDPLEIGLLEFARSRGSDVRAVRRAHPRVGGRPFDSQWKFMRATVEHDGRRISYLKGAPEILLARCQLDAHRRDYWRERADTGAHEGNRVLALASGEGEKEESLTFLGLVMLWDPPRPEVAAAIGMAQAAGVRVLMITGDHPGTARAVARAIGLEHAAVRTGAELDGMAPEELLEAARITNVFARVSPEHKLQIVEALKADGQIVAVTGDGVNDAPALKRSDVGIAMGQRGSDVAREVADLVLLDDDFASIVGAIEEGRSIYENIQTFIRFTFSTNVALILLVVMGAAGSYALGLRDPAGMLMLPLTALQLLWINFLGDGPPALALAVDRNPDVMRRPPRPARSALLDRASMSFIAALGLFQGSLGIAFLVVMPLFGYALVAVRTAVFFYESIAKLVSVYPARRLFRRPLTNPLLHACVAVGIGIQIAAIAVPGLRHALGLSLLDGRALLLVAAAIAASWAAAHVANAAIRRRMPRPVLEGPLPHRVTHA